MLKYILLFLLSNGVFSVYGQSRYNFMHDIEHADDGVTWIGGAMWSKNDNKSTDYYVEKLDRKGERTIYRFGDNGNDYMYDMALYPNGDLLLFGDSNSEDGDLKTANLGERDMFAIRIDQEGEIVWTKVFGSKDNDAGTTVRSLGDGRMVIAGHQNDKPWVGCIDSDGQLLWEQAFDDNYENKANVYTMELLNDKTLLVGITETDKTGQLISAVNTLDINNGHCRYNLFDLGQIVNIVEHTATEALLETYRDENKGIYQIIDQDGEILYPLVLENQVPSAATVWNDEFVVFTEGGQLLRINLYGELLSQEVYNENYIVTNAKVDENNELWVTGIAKKDKSVWYATLSNQNEEKSIDQYEWTNFTIYPNPASNFVQLEWSSSSDIAISIYTINGMRLDEINIVDENVYQLDIRNYPSGIYTIILNDGNHQETRRLIIE